MNIALKQMVRKFLEEIYSHGYRPPENKIEDECLDITEEIETNFNSDFDAWKADWDEQRRCEKYR